MRLLFTSFTYAPHQNGVAAVVRAQAEGLARRGHHVVVATGWDAQREGRRDWNGVQVEEFRLDGSKLDDPAERRRYEEFIASFPADVLICHCWEMWTTVAAAPVLHRTSARKILVSHGYTQHRWIPYRRFAWGLGQWVRRWPFVARSATLARKFDRLVVLSERCDSGNFIDHSIAKALKWERCVVIPNGTELDRFRRPLGAFRRKLGLGDELLILQVGVYAPSKNQKLAVRAFLRADLHNAVLVFIGNEFNTYFETVRTVYENATPKSRARVIFLEGQTREEILNAYSDADMVLLSSPSETQPLVLLDAMAAGKPFVSTDVGCAADFPGGVVARGERALAGAMRRLASSPELRAQLGEAGKQACRETYNWETVLDNYENLLAQVMKDGH